MSYNDDQQNAGWQNVKGQNAQGQNVKGQNALDRLIALFAKLPGVGKKSAGRIAYHILDGSPAFAHLLAGELDCLHSAIRRCSVCGGFTESDPCPVCASPDRDRSIICVVERAQDVRIIEEAREFHGVFHVLGGLIAPLEGIGPNDLSIGRLISRIGGFPGASAPADSGQPVKELILALNPTVEGDTTALYIQKLLKDFPVEITRLASGLPVGGDLEYTDRLTLSRSFRGRVKL